MGTKRYAKDVRALARRALAAGATRRGWLTVEWDLGGDCEQPYTTVVEGRPQHRHAKGIVIDRLAGDNRTFAVEIDTRCRNCPACHRARRRMWTHRAIYETQHSVRTWFGTFTIRPEEHYRFGIKARRDFGPGWDELTDDRKFRLVDRAIWAELSLWLKRLRRRYGSSVRHFTVCEKHASGLPHYHMLVHQVVETPALVYRQLEGDWPFGYTKFVLVKDEREAAYVAKYTSKSNLARVRASVAYGLDASETASEANIKGTHSTEGEYMTSSLSGPSQKHSNIEEELS